MKQTRLMSKLFSDDTPIEYKEKIQDKIEEAKDNGSSTFEEDGEVLQFAEVDGDVIIEDQTDGANEVTRASDNEDDPNDIVLSAVEIPDETKEETEEKSEEKVEETPEEKTEEKVEEKSEEKSEEKVEEKVEEEPKEEKPEEKAEEETKKESEIVPSVEISQLPGVDGDSAEEIIPDLSIEVKEADDYEDALFSLKFKNCKRSYAQKFSKIFSEIVCPCMKAIQQADVDEDVQVKFEDDKMKVMSVHFGKPIKVFSEEKPEEEVKEADVTEVLDAASDLAECCKEGISKEKVDEVKEKANIVLEMAKELEDKGVRMECIKSMCSRFSEEADKVAEETKVAETPKDKDGENIVETIEETEEEKEMVKTESLNPQVIECDGKWCIEGDPEKREFDTQEEAEQVAAKSFSEPKATLTIEGLEAASVADLLKPEGANKIDNTEFEKSEDVEPKEDPNEGGQGRRFSITSDHKSINPYLTTEIN